MQATALYKTICSLGVECIVLDYNRKIHHKNFIKISGKNIKGKLYQLLQLPMRIRLSRKFDRFSKAEMELSESYNGFSALENVNTDDNAIFISGSDQVWNCALTENDTRYFLDFTESYNKYSYAASFGTSNIEDTMIEKCKCLLQKFAMISVREETGARIVDEICGRKAEVVCDPVFLLSSMQWNQIANSQFNEKKPYILLFMLTYDEKLINSARELACVKNIKVLNLGYSIKNIEGIKDIYGLGPDEWLAYVSHAKYVFTNSFHGFAVSLNMEKNVYVALSNNGRNSRILDMAKRYEAEKAIIKENFIEQELDYDKIRKLISIDREKSLNYLKGIIHGNAKGE